MKLAAYSLAMALMIGLIVLAAGRLSAPHPASLVNEVQVVTVTNQPSGQSYHVNSPDQITPAFADIAHHILNRPNPSPATVTNPAPADASHP